MPDKQEKGAEKILNLAEQPLLLLMLALYDSQSNQLKNSKGLDRTKLYDSLLRRFVIRERGKEKGFNDAQAKEREKALSTEMQRLGVAALGMYNRRKVHILSPELDDDLTFFKLERELAAKSGKALSQADLLLGSFFFVHKSKAQHNSGAEETHEETAAFEFLHNTFGEFLTADFILRRAVAQVQALRAAESNDALRSIIDKMMGTADGFERDWFASLVYTPLFTRPVIMEMIREWAPHVLKELGLNEENFVETLEKIVLNQIKRLLNKREMPQIMRKETAQEGYRVPFGDHPLVGHIAIYSINLVLLRLIAGKRPFIFDECEVASHEDGTRPWDRLMHIWRSWFALGNLNALTAVMLAERTDSKITVTAKKKFQAEESKSKLHDFTNVALSLGDNVAAGIAGLYLFDPARESGGSLDILDQRLRSEGFDLGLPISILRLLMLARVFPGSTREFARHGKRAVEQAMQVGRRDQLESVCQIIARTFEQNNVTMLRVSGPDSVFREIFDPHDAVEIAMRDPRSARIIYSLCKQFLDHKWALEFSRRFIDYTMHKLPLEMAEPDSGDWFEWLQLMRDIGDMGMLPHHMNKGMRSEFFERMFHPRHLLELSERNPEMALAYLQTMKKLGGERYLDRLIGEDMEPDFLDRMLHPRHLQKLSERNPEGMLAYLQILRELGGERYLERFVGEDMEPKFLDRMLHPRHLLELSERNPEAALAYLQTLRKLGGSRYLERLLDEDMEPEFLKRMFHPRHLLELSERNPEAALANLQILQELGGGRYLERLLDKGMEPEFLKRMFHPRHLLELSERNPEAALAYLQILQELGGGRYLERFLDKGMEPEFLDRMLRPRHLLELSERNPEAALAYLQILRELSGGRYLERFLDKGMEPEFLDRMLRPRDLLELSERNPEAALAYLQILRELGGGQYLERFVGKGMEPELLDRMLRPHYLLKLSGHRNSSLSVWLALARLFQSKRLNQALIEVFSESFRHRDGAKHRLSLLPISSLADLRWLSEQTESPELQHWLAEFTS